MTKRIAKTAKERQKKFEDNQRNKGFLKRYIWATLEEHKKIKNNLVKSRVIY